MQVDTGKSVIQLEYQAYSKLAIRTMRSIVDATMIQQSQHDVKQCVVEHRLGVVPVGEPSIVIAVSAPHRKEAFVACEEILEQVKVKAQIWKREVYNDYTDAEWKANAAL